MSITRITATLAAAALLASLPAQAAEYSAVLADKSSVSFSFKQMGVPVDGRFRTFSAQVGFDPSRPQAARASIEISLASIDAGSAEANDEAVGKQWFNVKAFPTAKFVATGVRPLGGNRYELAGKLTIKGRTQDAVAPFTFRQEGNLGIFDGSFVLKRADFAIGEGAWADFATVANEVPIRFRIVAAHAAVRQ